MTIAEKALGPEHPQTLEAANVLGVILYLKGDYHEAATVHRRVLEVRARTLGWEHPDTAHSMNELAQVLRSQGNLEEAEPLYRRALAPTRPAGPTLSLASFSALSVLSVVKSFRCSSGTVFTNAGSRK